MYHIARLHKRKSHKNTVCKVSKKQGKKKEEGTDQIPFLFLFCNYVTFFELSKNDIIT